MSEHYRTVDDTVWPVNLDDFVWKLRYAHDHLTRSDALVLASAVSAYYHLTVPNITQKDAVAKLRRARRAVADAERARLTGEGDRE